MVVGKFISSLFPISSKSSRPVELKSFPDKLVKIKIFYRLLSLARKEICINSFATACLTENPISLNLHRDPKVFYEIEENPCDSRQSALVGKRLSEILRADEIDK